MLKENLDEVRQRIEMACQRAGRKTDEVTLIAVSKTKPISMIEEILSYGIIEFGENKPQELKEKQETLQKNLHWHMIGHLQRNKIKSIIDKTCLIHSVDSLKLAQAIDMEAKKAGLIVPILIEVNIAGEESKFGISEEDAEAMIRQIAPLSNIRIEGLMCIAPFVQCAEDNRRYFRNLRKLYVDIKSKNIDNVNMRNLSMGMTGDFEVAIEEGATLVRVGTGIFGERKYLK